MGTPPNFVDGTIVHAADLDWMLSYPIGGYVQDVSQSISAATFTPITFNSETADRDNQHATNASRVIIGGTLGYYGVSGLTAWGVPIAANGSRRSLIAFNGVAVNGSYGIFTTPTAMASGLISVAAATVIVQATASSDFVELWGWAEAATSTSVSGNFRSSMFVQYLGN